MLSYLSTCAPPFSDGFSRQLPPRLEITGVGGLRLADYWKSKGGPEAYYGLAVPNFPNYFMLLGTFREGLARRVLVGTDLARYFGLRAQQRRWTRVRYIHRRSAGTYDLFHRTE